MIIDFLIDKLIEASYPSVDSTKCLHLKGDKGCDICASICPKEAIKLNKNEFHLEKELCNNCGICSAACPTQSIYVKELGEESILHNIGEKVNPVFFCKIKSLEGNIGVSCLNAIHPELLSLLFIFNAEKTVYFNISGCEDCEMKSPLLMENLNKAAQFLTSIGINPNYELLLDEKCASELCSEVISRRDLFKLIKKNSSNVASNVLNTIINDENKMSIREYLLKVIEEREIQVPVINELFNFYYVTDECNGCGQCEGLCLNHAWKVEEKENIITVLHNAGRCYKCEICIEGCPNNAIYKSFEVSKELLEYRIMKKIEQSICHSCGKKFIPNSQLQEKCNICIKKEELRKKIASSNF